MCGVHGQLVWVEVLVRLPRDAEIVVPELAELGGVGTTVRGSPLVCWRGRHRLSRCGTGIRPCGGVDLTLVRTVRWSLLSESGRRTRPAQIADQHSSVVDMQVRIVLTRLTYGRRKRCFRRGEAQPRSRVRA